MGVILVPFLAPLLGFLTIIGIPFGVNVYSLEKALEFYQQEMPRMEQKVAELELHVTEKDQKIQRLEKENEELRQLATRKEGGDRQIAALEAEKAAPAEAMKLLRDALAAAAQSNSSLATGNQKLIAELQKLDAKFGEWTVDAQRIIDGLELEKQGWAGKALVFAKKVNALEREVRALRAKNAKLEEALRQKSASLSAKDTQLTNLRTDKDKNYKELARLKIDQDEKDTQYRAEIQRYRLAVTGLGAAFFITFMVLVFVLLHRRKP